MDRDLTQKIKQLYNTGALHITVGTFATKFVAFFGSIVVVRLLSKADYGLMSYVENIYSYAFLLAGLGLSNGILRYLVISDGGERKKQFHRYIIRRSMAIDAMLALALCGFAAIADVPGNYVAARYLIPVVALLLPFQDLLNEELYTVRSFFRNKLYAWLAFGSSFLLIVGRVAGAVLGGVGGVLWSRVIINMICAVALAAYVRVALLPRDTVEPLSPADRRIVDTYSLQYMVTNGFWAIIMLNDTFMLGQLLNDPIVMADYKVAYVLPGNVSIFATAIGVYVAPYFTRHERDLAWVRRNYRRVFAVSALAMGVVVGLISLFATPLISLMYGEQYLNVVGLMRGLLLASFLNSGLRYTSANLLAAMGEIKYNMFVSGAGVAAQLALDWFLIPRIGVMGVAVSNCVVYGTMALVLFVVFHKKYFANSREIGQGLS